eukprot:scaffold215400_cov35-Attheya_sp.AAC.1
MFRCQSKGGMVGKQTINNQLKEALQASFFNKTMFRTGSSGENPVSIPDPVLIPQYWGCVGILGQTPSSF